MGYPKQVINAIIGEFKKNKEADAAIIDAARADAADEGHDRSTACRASWRDEQERHTADVEQLQRRI